MEHIIKLSSLCMIAAIISLTIRKTQPEFALLLGTSIALYCIFAVIGVYRQIIEQIERWNVFMSDSKEYFVPLFKCLGISVVSHFSSEVCKDAGQSVAASGIELTANVTTVYCLLPIINHLFEIIEDLI